jgi:hypothetical protein
MVNGDWVELVDSVFRENKSEKNLKAIRSF